MACILPSPGFAERHRFDGTSCGVSLLPENTTTHLGAYEDLELRGEEILNGFLRSHPLASPRVPIALHG